jgi:hypothetical protein
MRSAIDVTWVDVEHRRAPLVEGAATLDEKRQGLTSREAYSFNDPCVVARDESGPRY